MECLIIGYTRGKGDREKKFGALHLAQLEDRELRYVGKVGTGFDERSFKAVASELAALTTIPRPIKAKPLDDAQSIWVEPKLVCEVQFGSRTKDGLLREPVFLRLRPDLQALASGTES
jgi:bifunctional non-homologous end joining protein LigD